MIGVGGVRAALAIAEDSTAPVHRRCLAARAIGLLGDDSAKERLDAWDPRDDSPFGRACRHADSDWFRRRDAESRLARKQTASETMNRFAWTSAAEVMAALEDRSALSVQREAAAAVLGGLRCRDAVATLIEALAEGQPNLSWTCMRALAEVGSRRRSRKLAEIARGNYPLAARQEAIYTLWRLRETRAESLFIRLSAAIDTEEAYTRDMATEALGNTCLRRTSQKALALRLFDPSPSIRYAALCACSMMLPQPFPFPGFLRHALLAKLEDPARLDANRVIATLAARLLGHPQNTT